MATTKPHSIRPKPISIWRNSGCPRSGSLNDKRVKIKMRYKCAIKEAVLASDLEFNDDLAKYLCKKDFNCFWKAWRKRFCHSNLTPTDCLNTKVGPENVLSEFTSHFKKVSMPNTAGADESYKNKVLHHLLINNESVDCVPFIDVSLILDKVCTLKPRKSGGHDSIQNENIIHARPNLAVHLCLLFNALLQHSFVPDDFRSGIIKPLLKNKHGDHTKVDMYRGITLTPVFSKLFESVLTSLYSSFLYSDHLQFGFKANSGCNDALFRRNVPLHFIRLLFYWFNNMSCSVVWMTLMSDAFCVSSGVRQGAVLSPLLFAVYVDDLIADLYYSSTEAALL